MFAFASTSRPSIAVKLEPMPETLSPLASPFKMEQDPAFSVPAESMLPPAGSDEGSDFVGDG